MLDHVEEDIVICFVCDERLAYGEQFRDIEEGIICSQECYDKYLGFDASLNELIKIHREQEI